MLFGFGKRKNGQKDKEKAGEKERGTKSKDKAQETIRRRTEPTMPTRNKSSEEPAVVTAEPEALPEPLPRRASLKKKAQASPLNAMVKLLRFETAKHSVRLNPLHLEKESPASLLLCARCPHHHL
jgi:hypothetical protein